MYPLDGFRDVFVDALRQGTFPKGAKYQLVTRWNDALKEFNKRYDINDHGTYLYTPKG